MRRGAVLALPLLAWSTARAQARPTADSGSLASFINEFLGSAHALDSLPRGAIVFVDAQGIVLARGFGISASGRPVDPESTVFRAASNSKLVVALAVLQLVRSGQLDLATNVNRYLPLEARLSDAFDRPVTLQDLLTHTAGLDSKFEGAVVSVAHRSTLARYFAAHVPSRVTPPGEEIVYSNIGVALAGYVVERSAHIAFDEYAERHIFQPLGMTRSSFAQPSPPAIASALAGGSPRADRIIAFNPYPAASLVTTPNDMGRFISAQLKGRSPALDSAGTALMQAPHWRAQPNTPDAAYGFFEGERAGRRYLFHTGDSGDHSLVLLVPSAKLGFYFVYSGSDAQSGLRERLANAFLDRFVGAREAPVRLAASANPPPAVPLSRFAGRYRTAAFSRTNYEKMRSALLQVRVTARDDGTLAVTPPGSGPAVRLLPVDGRTFVGDSGEVVAFRYGSDGTVRGFTLTGSVWDPSSWDRIAWYQSTSFLMTLVGIWLALALARAVIAPPVVWLVERRVVPRRPRSRAWVWTGIGAWITLGAPLVGFARAMTSFLIPAEALGAGVHAGSVVLVVGIVMSLAGAVALWREAVAARWPRIAAGTMATASVVGMGLVLYWRLLPVG